MKEFFKNLVYLVLSFFYFDGAVILMYHSVDSNTECSTVSVENFDKQMAYLKEKGFNVIKLSDLAELLKNAKKIIPKTIILTFDDGYEDNFVNVFPILKKYDFSATIFISTASIGKLLEARTGAMIKLISESQIIEMQASGLVKFGSHSHNHTKLRKQEDKIIRNELKTSKEVLGNILSKEVKMMSYPSGSFDEKVEKLAREFFDVICTVKKGRIKNKEKCWRLKRNCVDSKTSFEQFKGMVKFGRL